MTLRAALRCKLPRRSLLRAGAGLTAATLGRPAGGLALAEDAPEPSGYRMDDYRAPTPRTLAGALVVSTEAAHALWQSGAARFIDVLPQPPRPPSLPAGTIWHPRPREDIPGSIWLPDVGYGALAPVMEGYFRRGLEKASGGERGRLLVFYCLPGCWHSWNAAKRALALGWPHVAWYPDGTEGWARAGYPTEARAPLERPDVTAPAG